MAIQIDENKRELTGTLEELLDHEDCKDIKRTKNVEKMLRENPKKEVTFHLGPLNPTQTDQENKVVEYLQSKGIKCEHGSEFIANEGDDIRLYHPDIYLEDPYNLYIEVLNHPDIEENQEKKENDEKKFNMYRENGIPFLPITNQEVDNPNESYKKHIDDILKQYEQAQPESVQANPKQKSRPAPENIENKVQNANPEAQSQGNSTSAKEANDNYAKPSRAYEIAGAIGTFFLCIAYVLLL